MRLLHRFFSNKASNSVADAVASIPSCSSACLNTYAASVNCSATDFACQCNDPPILPLSTTTCVLNACALFNSTAVAEGFARVCNLLKSSSSSSASSTSAPSSTSSTSSVAITTSNTATPSLPSSSIPGDVVPGITIPSNTIPTTSAPSTSLQSISTQTTSLQTTSLQTTSAQSIIAQSTTAQSTTAVAAPSAQTTATDSSTEAATQGITAKPSSSFTYTDKFIIAMVVSGTSLILAIIILVILLRRNRKYRRRSHRNSMEERFSPSSEKRGGGEKDWGWKNIRVDRGLSISSSLYPWSAKRKTATSLKVDKETKNQLSFSQELKMMEEERGPFPRSYTTEAERSSPFPVFNAVESERGSVVDPADPGTASPFSVADRDLSRQLKEMEAITVALLPTSQNTEPHQIQPLPVASEKVETARNISPSQDIGAEQSLQSPLRKSAKENDLSLSKLTGDPPPKVKRPPLAFFLNRRTSNSPQPAAPAPATAPNPAPVQPRTQFQPQVQVVQIPTQNFPINKPSMFKPAYNQNNAPPSPPATLSPSIRNLNLNPFNLTASEMGSSRASSVRESYYSDASFTPSENRAIGAVVNAFRQKPPSQVYRGSITSAEDRQFGPAVKAFGFPEPPEVPGAKQPQSHFSVSTTGYSQG